MHVLKYSDWQSPSGRWYCNDVTDLAGVSAKWYAPLRMLDISVKDFILLLINEFNAVIDTYNPDKDFLMYHWDNYADCHRFVLYINREARKRNYMC